MMHPPRTTVTVNGVRLEVPTYRDPSTTARLAEDFTARLRGIEEASERIDTQRFALEAGMQYATEVAKSRDDHAASEDEIHRALSDLNNTLERLIGTMTQPDTPRPRS